MTDIGAIDLRRVAEAAEVLQWLSARADRLPEERECALELRTALDQALLYLLDYATHIDNGMEPFDALLATARGDLPKNAFG